eukprot:92311_1
MTDCINFIETVKILNVDRDISTISDKDIAFIKAFSPKLYLVSDADEQLLILVRFTTSINLQSIKIFAYDTNNDAQNEISAPKKVHIYKLKNLSKDFSDIHLLKPDKSINCSVKKLAKGQTINLQKTSRNAIQFKQLQHLAIYIESNQKK